MLFASAALAACGAPAPKDFGGAWTPVNRFQNAPTEIPLAAAYTFYASPLDATLQAMLRRWAADSGRQLNYQLGSDFTLYQPVGQIRTTDLQDAVQQLSAIYMPQGVLVAADAQRIQVHAVAPAPAEQR
ncbi:MAG: hypothetical protein JSS56_11270 [Proteobacteria bacterium]|nr:hypothetical protein [Pseudomonadota bacterium]